jgi:hypothetical protein
VVNVAHQLGGSLGLGILAAVAAAANGGIPEGRAHIAHSVAAALTAGTALLVLALILVLALNARSRTTEGTGAVAGAA